jgi:hypothetical protein
VLAVNELRVSSPHVPLELGEFGVEGGVVFHPVPLLEVRELVLDCWMVRQVDWAVAAEVAEVLAD